MPSDYTKPVPVSSSFRSENSGKASPSLYARQSPLPLPCPQQPLPGQSIPASAGEAAEHSLGSLLQGSRCSTPQPSLPSPQQATLSGNPCCQPRACPMVSELGREPLTLESSPISGVPRTYGCVSALLVTLGETRAPAVPSHLSGQCFIPGTARPVPCTGVYCTERPRRPRYTHTPSHQLCWRRSLLCFGFTLSSLPLCTWALLSPFPPKNLLQVQDVEAEALGLVIC